MPSGSETVGLNDLMRRTLVSSLAECLISRPADQVEFIAKNIDDVAYTYVSVYKDIRREEQVRANTHGNLGNDITGFDIPSSISEFADLIASWDSSSDASSKMVPFCLLEYIQRSVSGFKYFLGEISDIGVCRISGELAFSSDHRRFESDRWLILVPSLTVSELQTLISLILSNL
jgi:hypothetical protein